MTDPPPILPCVVLLVPDRPGALAAVQRFATNRFLKWCKRHGLRCVCIRDPQGWELYQGEQVLKRRKPR